MNKKQGYVVSDIQQTVLKMDKNNTTETNQISKIHGKGYDLYILDHCQSSIYEYTQVYYYKLVKNSGETWTCYQVFEGNPDSKKHLMNFKEKVYDPTKTKWKRISSRGHTEKNEHVDELFNQKLKLLKNAQPKNVSDLNFHCRYFKRLCEVSNIKPDVLLFKLQS